MSRYLRRYCPGGAFHITTRFQGRAHLLDETARTLAVEIIDDAAARTDARLLAFAVMSNHVHLVVRQGEDPLWRTMQPIFRRIAMLVQRSCRTDGHVFERRFRDRQCMSADHLREAIVYTHLNPVRALLCATPGEYAWTSHHCYESVSSNAMESSSRKGLTRPALDLFGHRDHSTRSELFANYSAYLEYRMCCDSADALGRPRPREPSFFPAGDHYWERRFAGMDIDREVAKRVKRRDLRDIARQYLDFEAPGLPIDALRGSHLPSRVLRLLRRDIVQSASKEGYSGMTIARFFGMSSSRVSEIRCKREAVGN